MAIFKVPRITTAQRLGITLEAAEIVFDTNLSQFFGGDGSTAGGISIGAGISVETRVLTTQEITDKKLTLNTTPLTPSNILLTPEGGIPQRYGIDFTVSGNELSWNGLGLDGFLASGEYITIVY